MADNLLRNYVDEPVKVHRNIIGITLKVVESKAVLNAENKVEIGAYNSDKKQLSFKYAKEVEE